VQGFDFCVKLTAKIKSAATKPKMVCAYARWIGARFFTGRSPVLSLAEGTRLGGWLSFSEYWSFQDTFREIVTAPERHFIERCLAKRRGGGTAFDIGANVGVFTCLIAGMGQHNVHAFEPIPETFCRLKQNVQANGMLDNCRLNCLAIGRGPDLVTFRVTENSSDTNQMVAFGTRPGGKSRGIQTVAVIDLDGYCHRQKIDYIDFLKIDVEGMEPHVLQGAHTLLKERKIGAILIEICPANLQAVGLSVESLYREFESARYAPYALSDDGNPNTKLSMTEIASIRLANVVLLPDT
jgi:FkbM family methyltransferase